MQKEIVANTFTPLYDGIEDRIRLVVNYQDFANRVDIMITRAFLLQLLPAIEEYIQNHYQEELEDNISVTPKEAFTKTNQEDLSFLAKDGELLQKLDLSYIKDTKETLIVFKTSTTTIKSLANETILRNIIKSIKSSIPYFSWGISPSF